MRHSKPSAKLVMLIIFPLLLLCYGVGIVNCSTINENSQDFNSLLDFKKGITDDPNGALTNWTSNTHFCRWNGVACTSQPPYRVMKLALPNKNLAGQISSSLGNLTFLNVLDLSTNYLHGVIPDTLTNCSNLTQLVLYENNLAGVIPPSIGSLTKLEILFIYRNNLSGVIPPGLGNITDLSEIDLAENQLNGPIPSNFWQMPKIALLFLDNNYLSGEIPQTLSNLSSLQQLSLAYNNLGNTLPSNFGDAIRNIQLLYLTNNMFEGHIPASLGNASGLNELFLSYNMFTGQIPSTFGKLSVLSTLSLEQNMLEARDSAGWEFFDALANCSYLKVLALDANNLQGVIPTSIANLSTNLKNLLLNENHLSGIVPPSIGNLNGLIELSLSYNNFTGTIDEWIGKLTNLQLLNLTDNYFVGAIPPSISNLTHLSRLWLGNNKFTGLIPTSLGNLQQMNNLNLSNNSFRGSIPVEFGNLKQLVFLDVSSNQLGGEIPETLGQCQGITTIQMNQNVLTGNIPATFSNLSSLTVLNLSHNNLSGPLPASLNDLKSLSKLDLSYNDFQGEIPTTGIFDNATVVSLDGNPGLCGGAMDLHMHSCHHVSRRARIANYLIKILIPIFGFMSLLLLIYFLLLEKKTSRRAQSQLSIGENFEKVSYNDLAQATRDFSESNLIGRGSYGSVYSGKLKETKMEVAVKVFNLEMRGAERSFLAECEALRSIQHRNLLSIITACSTVDNVGNVFKALVYELMPNGNLDTWIHNRGDEAAPNKRLSLTQRIGILVNVADALDYLHHDCGRPTVHCDLKPSNILLNDDMNALLADFGIARLYVDPHSTWAGSISSIGVKGTIGYIAPEYGGGGHASTSGDVYSFGVVTLEILTGKRPTDPMFTDGLDIISFVENSCPDQIFHVIDAHLVEECKNFTQEKKVTENEIYQCLVALLQVALSCTRSPPSERSNMKQVSSKMHAIKASQLGWNGK